MTALSDALAVKVSKIIGQFGSENPHVVTTAAAVLRSTLSSNGCDLNDLATHIAERPRETIRYIERGPRPEPAAYPFRAWRDVGRQPRGPGAHRYLVVRCQNASAGRLSEWEASFLLSIGQRLERGLSLTPKQVSTLNSIAERLGVA